MSTLNGKRLLVLGGAYQHRKIVSTARQLGIITFVTDYLDIRDSPAKQMADFPLNCNIFDVDGLEDICARHHIDGVIGPYLDVSQRPYQELCERRGFHCFGNKEQHTILTDKQLFREFCIANGADVIPSYSEQDINDSNAEYPILIKPSDSRGSRGQSICYSHKEALAGIEAARAESKSGRVVIEKYMGSKNDVQLVYLVIGGEPILYKIEDRYTGINSPGLETLCIATITPSRHQDIFMRNSDAKVKNMIRALNLKNAPVFIQAFIDGDKARLYDPGLRMPGDDYECGYKLATGIDIPEMFIRFALTGEFFVKESRVRPCTDKFIAMILPCLKPGRIAEIGGLDEIAEWPETASFTVSHKEGDDVASYNDVRQRLGEFVMVSDNADGLRESIERLFSTLKVSSTSGEDMLTAKFDTVELETYRSIKLGRE